MLKIEELDEIKEELVDRFGRLSPNVERLILAATLRFYASVALFERIIVQLNKVTIILPKGDKEQFYKEKFTSLLSFINKNYSKEIKFVQTNDNLKLEMNNKFNSPESVMDFLIKFCKEVTEVLSKS
jgi:transcription-repair coupling factor (superfamily II helicase)